MEHVFQQMFPVGMLKYRISYKWEGFWSPCPELSFLPGLGLSCTLPCPRSPVKVCDTWLHFHAFFNIYIYINHIGPRKDIELRSAHWNVNNVSKKDYFWGCLPSVTPWGGGVDAVRRVDVVWFATNCTHNFLHQKMWHVIRVFSYPSFSTFHFIKAFSSCHFVAKTLWGRAFFCYRLVETLFIQQDHKNNVFLCPN